MTDTPLHRATPSFACRAIVIVGAGCATAGMFWQKSEEIGDEKHFAACSPTDHTYLLAIAACTLAGAAL